MVVTIGKAALALDRQIEILDPLPMLRDPAAPRLDLQRKAVRHAHHKCVADS
jgi:hypothetical protein